MDQLQIPLANTTNVRAHLRRHRVVVARLPSSRISRDTADALAAVPIPTEDDNKGIRQPALGSQSS